MVSNLLDYESDILATRPPAGYVNNVVMSNVILRALHCVVDSFVAVSCLSLDEA